MPRKRSAKPTDADFRGDQSSEPLLMEDHLPGGEDTPVVQEQPTKQVKGRAMPIIDPSEWNLGDLPDLKVLPAGTEALCRITEVQFGTDTSKHDYFLVFLDIKTDEMAKEFTHFMNMPSNDMPKKRLDGLYRGWKDFGICFNLDFARPHDPTTDWVDAEGWVILGIEPAKGRYPEKNNIARFILPQ